MHAHRHERMAPRTAGVDPLTSYRDLASSGTHPAPRVSDRRSGRQVDGDRVHGHGDRPASAGYACVVERRMDGSLDQLCAGRACESRGVDVVLRDVDVHLVPSACRWLRSCISSYCQVRKASPSALVMEIHDR